MKYLGVINEEHCHNSQMRDEGKLGNFPEGFRIEKSGPSKCHLS